MPSFRIRFGLVAILLLRGSVVGAQGPVLLRKNPVYVFEAANTRWLALTTEGGANRIYRAESTRFVRMTGARCSTIKAAPRRSSRTVSKGQTAKRDLVNPPAGPSGSRGSRNFRTPTCFVSLEPRHER